MSACIHPATSAEVNEANLFDTCRRMCTLEEYTTNTDN